MATPTPKYNAMIEKLMKERKVNYTEAVILIAEDKKMSKVARDEANSITMQYYINMYLDMCDGDIYYDGQYFCFTVEHGMHAKTDEELMKELIDDTYPYQRKYDKATGFIKKNKKGILKMLKEQIPKLPCDAEPNPEDNIFTD